MMSVWDNIDTHDNDPSVCWEWRGSTAGRDSRGYISIDKRKYIVTRIVFELCYGPIPDGVVIRHTCDNPICCNPTHLVPGSRSDNELDKYQRDRNSNAYTNTQVRRIKQLLANGHSYAEVALIAGQEFNRSFSTSGIAKIYQGKRRKEG